MSGGHPSQIGSYEVVRFLGEGGAGRVYACRDPALDRDVAVKILRPEVAQDKTRRDRFMREGKMMARIRSPHVASVFAVGKQDQMPFLVMELLDGEDLESRLRTGGPMSNADALSVTRQASLGLDAAKDLDVIHRDVKPANIVATARGVKITDFGLARPQDGSAQVTTEGLVTGTPAFLAPERAMGKGDDLRSDIYSLGATLYTLLAGRPPFVRETAIEVITAHLREKAVPIQEMVPSVGLNVGLLVARMMEKDPALRHQTYVDLIADIDLCLVGNDTELTIVNDPFASPTSSVHSTVGAPTGVMGSLKQMALADITQMLEIGRKTATVDFIPKDQERGVVTFVEGQAVYATFGGQEGAEAFYGLARLKEGSFRIRYGRGADDLNIEVPTQYLLLEAMRRVDEEISGKSDRDLIPGAPVGDGVSINTENARALKAPAGKGVNPNAATVRSPLSPGADVGTLTDLPDAPPPMAGDEDALAPRDTLVVRDDDDEEEYRGPTVRMVTQPFDDPTDAMEANPFDVDGGPTEEMGDPDITAPQGMPTTHPTPDSLSGSGFEREIETEGVNRETPRPVDLDDTLPAATLFQKAPWLQTLDTAILSASRRALNRLRAQPWLLGILILPLLLVVVVVLAIASGGASTPSLKRIDAGQAAQVLAELERIPSAERTPQQRLLRVHALVALEEPDAATVELKKAVKDGAHDRRALEFLIAQLDRHQASAAIDLLVIWPGDKVSGKLVEQTEREAYAPRRNAVTALKEREEEDAYDHFSVALKDLRDAPSCPERRTALTFIRKQVKKAPKAQATLARTAVEEAADRAGNDCMGNLFTKMLPDRYQR